MGDEVPQTPYRAPPLDPAGGLPSPRSPNNRPAQILKRGSANVVTTTNAATNSTIIML